MKTCIICSNTFTPVKHNQITCGIECRKVNNHNKKRDSFLRLKDSKDELLHTLSLEWKIPKYVILQYGIDFLKENEAVREALVMSNRLSGKFYLLSPEDIEVRRKALIRDNNLKQRLKKGYKKVSCKVCNTEFTKEGSKSGNNRLTCSDECSTKLHKIQSYESNKRRNEKLKDIRRSIIVDVTITNKCNCCGNDFNPSKYNKSARFCPSCKNTFGDNALNRKLEFCILSLK